MSRKAYHYSEAASQASNIVFKQPSSLKPSGKTLIQQAQNCESASNALPEKQPATSLSTDANSTSTSPSQTTALITTLLYSPTLTLLHFTFHILVLHQYSQLGSSLTSSSSNRTLLLSLLWQILRQYLLPYAILVYVVHTPFFPFLHRPRLRDISFTIASIVAGCTLMRMSYRAPYLEMVDKAPAVATLWLWCVLEMGIGGAMAMIGAVGGFAWWFGYGFR